KDTTEAKLMASSVCGLEPVFARIRRLRICQSPGNLIPRRPVNSESDQWVARRLATRPRRKPSADIKWAKSSGRTSKTLPKAVKTVAAPESGWGNREKLQAENDNHP